MFSFPLIIDLIQIWSLVLLYRSGIWAGACKEKQKEIFFFA
jgi:hypothetical protein